MAFQVLTLSGGGFLGLYSIAVLAELEKVSKEPLGTRFDLLAGTSIGGIVALGLAAGVSAGKIKSAFEENGKKIFGNRPPPTSPFGVFKDIISGAFSSKYEASALRETIESIVGGDTRIGDLRHPVLIPAINLSKGKPNI